MPQDPLISRIAPSQRKRKFRQAELDTPSSSSRAPSPISEAEIERWTPSVQRGTRHVPPVVCMTDARPHVVTEVPVDNSVLTLGRDRVTMDSDTTRIWSVERAKYAQWQHRTGHSDAILARLGITKHQRSLQAAARGARLPGWTYLAQLMALLELDTIVGPSILEAPPTELWTAAYKDFQWSDSAALLVFLEWVPPDKRAEVLSESQCQTQQVGILARHNAISSDLEQVLDGDWTPHIVNRDYPFVHKPHWWMTGNQGLDKTSDVFTVWTHRFVSSLPLQHIAFQPPLPLTRPEDLDLRVYFDNTPSGPYRHRQGQHIWTDGSKIETADAQLVWAGYVGYMPLYTVHYFQVGGPATNLRGEMAAVARAMAHADPHSPLTLYTDCMAILNAIARWCRGDFQPLMEEEKHQDILTDLLQAIRRRTETTLVVWVAAHIGDPGNELADMAANAGMGEENCSWDLDTCPIALHSISTSTFQLLHEANWTPTVDLHVRTHVGKQQAEWLRNFSEAKSSDFSLSEGNGREILGAVLQDKTIPEQAIRDLFQARSFCFPTAAIVSHNQGGTWDTQ
eukprot:3941448-Rhodomonas_salina.1